ncbi:MAG: hypothetical protein ACI9EF_000768 [Pseudohongiellaceae bacterium]|jgi:hypothetical protein
MRLITSSSLSLGLPRVVATSMLSLALLTPALLAQWSTDDSVNLAVADGGSDQSQPKVVATADGGAWVSWFDGIGTGWDVRVSRLDVGGIEAIGHGGVLLADRGFSSTQDYGLDVDGAGNALLAYRDDSGVGVQISASKVAPDGSLLWGSSGVQLTSTTAFVAAPAIAATSDGGAVVAWTQNSGIVIRRLDSSGAFAGPPVEYTPGVGSYSVSDMHGAGNDVIVSFVHQLGGFGSPRHLLAQKIDASGSALWGAAHVAVFDGGSLQFGNFPDFSTDGSGGAIFSWYDTGSLQLQCSVQHVLSNGTEAFGHNGSVVSTNATQVRVAPWATFDQATGLTYACWIELSSNQSLNGISAQQFSAAGARQWGSSGAVIVPLGGDDITSARVMVSGGQTLMAWDAAPSFGNSQLLGALVDNSGSVSTGPFSVSSTPSSKSRLVMLPSTAGFGVLAWADDRNDGGDIFVQNVNGDGSLGPRWSELLGGTTGVAGVPVLSGSGSLTAGSELGVTLTSAPPSEFALLWVSLASTPVNFFGGTIHALPVALELLVVTDSAGAFDLATSFPAGVPSGSELVFQYLCLDFSNPFGKSLSNAQRGTAP